MKSLKFLSTRILHGVAVACLCLICTAFGSYAETIDEEDRQPVPFRYSLMQEKTTPFWIEIIQSEDHSVLENLQLKEKYAIPYERDYVWAELHEIGAWAFFGSKLNKLALPFSVKEIGKAAFQWSELEEIILNEGLEYIGDEAFASSKLKSINIPASVKVIGTQSFVNCQELESVTIPATITNFYGHTFAFCSNLKEMYCHALTPPVASVSDFYTKDEIEPSPDSSPSYNYHSNIDFDKCVVYVPAASVELYKKAPGWSLFKNIRSLE